MIFLQSLVFALVFPVPYDNHLSHERPSGNAVSITIKMRRTVSSLCLSRTLVRAVEVSAVKADPESSGIWWAGSY